MSRTTRVALAALVLVMVNAPFAVHLWLGHRLDREGVDVFVRLLKAERHDEDRLVTFELPGDMAARGRRQTVQVDASAFTRAVTTGLVEVRRLPDEDGLWRVDGQTRGHLWLVTLVVDALLIALATQARRLRRLLFEESAEEPVDEPHDSGGREHSAERDQRSR